MNTIKSPTMEELKRKRKESLRISEKAINEHPNEYREIKDLVSKILSKPLDVSDYYRTAVKLADMPPWHIFSEACSPPWCHSCFIIASASIND